MAQLWINIRLWDLPVTQYPSLFNTMATLHLQKMPEKDNILKALLGVRLLLSTVDFRVKTDTFTLVEG